MYETAAEVNKKIVPVVVYFCASKYIEVDVPENIVDEQEIRDYVQKLLRADLPEVVKDCDFEYPSYAALVVDGETSEEEIDID
jgi:hypothetical protein